ncbi:hypothetical protein [uncultured Demequina sp.]|uniref:hypothetical protein n=1 Tax=uncultured Demequina sp. TaxID=693499 RepID=UPI0025EFF054|nr:hypothetical protein [uncultured Demequina sp.]
MTFRSRQFSYQNRVVAWSLGLALALCLAIFAATGAWAETPVICLITIVVLFALLLIPLTITVDAEWVHVNLGGVLKRDVLLSDVKEIEKRTYRPIREFGGWGWRYGFKRRAVAYTMLGTSAVVLTMRDGTEVYLGVDDEQALVDAVRPRLAV